MMKTKPSSSFIKGWLLVAATLSIAGCESDSDERLVHWGGEEGAECMAQVLRTTIPERDPLVRTIQDFDVIYAVVDYTFRGRRDHLIVVSATDWEAKRVIRSVADWEKKRMFVPPEPVLPRQYRYYFQFGAQTPRLETLAQTAAVTEAVISEWEGSCQAGERWLLGGNPDPRAMLPVPHFKIENPELAAALAAMMKARSAGNHAEAIAKAREADAIEGKPPDLSFFLHNIILRSAIQAKDHTTALGELDRRIWAGEARPEDILRFEQSLSESDTR